MSRRIPIRAESAFVVAVRERMITIQLYAYELLDSCEVTQAHLDEAKARIMNAHWRAKGMDQ